MLSANLLPTLAAAALAGISTLTGFYVTHVVEELRNGYTVSYRVTQSAERIQKFRFENLSRTNAIDAAEFYILCADSDGTSRCFSRMDDESSPYARIEVEAPAFSRSKIMSGSSSVIRVCLSAVAASTTTINYSLVDSSAEVVVLYDPWPPEGSACVSAYPELRNMLFLNPHDPHALIVRHYLTFMSSALAVSASLLLVILVSVAWRAAFAHKKTEATTHATTPPRSTLLLLLDSGSDEPRRD